MKRLTRRLVLTGLVAGVLALGGCDLTDMNTNPNQATDAKPGELLTNAQLDFADLYWRDYAGAYWMRYAQHLTTNQYTTTDRFGFASSEQNSNNFNFNQAYLALNDLQEIIRLNRNSPEETSAFGAPANQIAVAKVMKAYVYQYLTDQYGPVPFDSALAGQSAGEFSPSYTSQPEIYSGLLTMLTEASDSIQTGGTAMASGDLIYNGDMAKWKKLANALKMRVAMRMSDQRPDMAATAINEAVQAGTFTSNDDNAEVPFGSPPYQNPIFENYNSGRDDWAAPQALTTFMNERNDPRRPAYFTDADPNQAGHQANGFPYGLPQDEAQPRFTAQDADFSRPSMKVRQPDFPAILMLYDEVQFIKAEAKIRSDMSVPAITQSADALYESAITGSMNYWGVSDQTAINSYLGGIPMPSDSNFDLEQNLGVQKWAAQYLQGIQAWSTWRRMDFQGVLQVPPGNPGGGTFGKQIAVRMAYPPDEQTLNGTNLEDAINNMLGGSGVSGPEAEDQGVLLWWDTEYQPTNPDL
jgi:hypothetical protein